MKISSTNSEEAYSTEWSARSAGRKRLSPGVSQHPGLDDGRDRGAPGEEEHTTVPCGTPVDRRNSCVPAPAFLYSIFEL
jgi:hypothetical protein